MASTLAESYKTKCSCSCVHFHKHATIFVTLALVAFDLKLGPFEPAHTDKMDFYLNLLYDT